ncbi:hypothetical protein ACVWZK_003287 [Bradyrhizobium sp. GM0.4]
MLPSSRVTISIFLSKVASSSFASSSSSSLMSLSAGLSACLRAKDNRLDVSAAPRSAASLISLVMVASGGLSFTASARISIVPVITVSMLLNSCAMPPVS